MFMHFRAENPVLPVLFQSSVVENEGHHFENIVYEFLFSN